MGSAHPTKIAYFFGDTPQALSHLERLNDLVVDLAACLKMQHSSSRLITTTEKIRVSYQANYYKQFLPTVFTYMSSLFI
jgi:hypothetical protein